jgi:hypothetical protein
MSLDVYHEEPQPRASNHGDSERKKKDHSLTGASRDVKKMRPPLSTKTALLSMCHCIIWQISN